MRLYEKVAQHSPLRRKHTGRIMDDYAFMCIYASKRNALNTHVSAFTSSNFDETGTSWALVSRRCLEFDHEFGGYPATVFDVDALRLAHSRTSVVFRAFGCALCPLRAGCLVLARTRRPAAT